MSAESMDALNHSLDQIISDAMAQAEELRRVRTYLRWTSGLAAVALVATVVMAVTR